MKIMEASAELISCDMVVTSSPTFFTSLNELCSFSLRKSVMLVVFDNLLLDPL